MHYPLIFLIEAATSRIILFHFQSSLREVYELEEAYAPFPSFDDMAWYALAYTRVHELYQLDGFLRVAKDIFHWSWSKGWDQYSDCGGIWFDQNHGACVCKISQLKPRLLFLQKIIDKSNFTLNLKSL